MLIDGDDIIAAGGDARRAILRKIGVMYQSGALFGSMTLLENVRLPLEEYTDLSPDEHRADRADEAAAGRPRVRSPDTCRRRSAAACRSARRSRARWRWIRSHPVPRRAFRGPRSHHVGRARRADHAAGAQSDVTFVVVTHELPSIFAIADRVIMLDKRTKAIIAEGKPRKYGSIRTIPGCASSSTAKRRDMTVHHESSDAAAGTRMEHMMAER